MTESRKQLGEALGKIPSGLFIVTAGSGDHATGLLASWVQQAAFEPPMLSVAIKKGRPIEAILGEDSAFIVHIAGKKNQDLVKHFLQGFPLDADAFEGIETGKGETGAPLLLETLGYLECQYRGQADAGDHILVLGEIVAGKINDAEDVPMTHIRPTGYHY